MIYTLQWVSCIWNFRQTRVKRN